MTRERRLRLGAVVAGAVFLLTVLAAGLYARSLPSEYTGTAVIQFSPNPTKNGGVVGGETVAQAAAGYVAYMGAPATLQQVSSKIGTDPATLKDGLTVTLLPTTTTVTVDYAADNPADAAEGANTMATAAVARAKGDPLVTAVELAPAAEPTRPSGPQRFAILAAGLLLAFLLAVLMIVGLVVVPARRRAITDWLDPEAPEAVADEAEPAGSVPDTSDNSPPRPPAQKPVLTVSVPTNGRPLPSEGIAP